MIISITEIELKSFWKLFRTIQISSKCIKYCKNDAYNLDVKVKSKGWRFHRTITVWENDEAMRKFIISEPHVLAMKYTPKLSENVKVHHYESDTIPTWEEAIDLLKKLHL